MKQTNKQQKNNVVQCTHVTHQFYYCLVILQPVTLVRDISDQTTVVNREAVFECEIKINYPEITLSWYKGTQRLDNSDKYEIKIVGNRHIMKIKNCQSSDQGNYRVVCGPHISSAKLTVQGMYTGMRLFIIWCQYSWVGYLLFS